MQPPTQNKASTRSGVSCPWTIQHGGESTVRLCHPRPIVSFPYQTTNHQKMPEIKLDQRAYECIKNSHTDRVADFSTKESASRKIPYQTKNHVENAHFPSGTNPHQARKNLGGPTGHSKCRCQEFTQSAARNTEESLSGTPQKFQLTYFTPHINLSASVDFNGLMTSG